MSAEVFFFIAAFVLVDGVLVGGWSLVRLFKKLRRVSWRSNFF